MREFTVVGSNVIVKEGAFLHRAIVHNNVYVGRGATLRGCVIGKNTDVMSQSRIEEGAVVGDECVIEPDSYVSAGVKVYPFKTIEAGAVVNTSVIWESRGQRTLFGPRGVSGLVNVEITPELCVRLASAYATTLKKGSVVTTVAGRLPRGPRAEAGGARRAQRQRDQRGRPGGPADAAGQVRDRAQRLQRRDRAAHDAGRPAVAGHHLHGLRRRGPVHGGAAQAGAGVLPAGVPPGVPRRDRRAVLPAAG